MVYGIRKAFFILFLVFSLLAPSIYSHTFVAYADEDDPLPAADVFLGDLIHNTYDGTPKHATVTTNPEGLSVQVTYDGSTTPPTNAGSYDLQVIVTDPDYSGSASGTFIISKAQPACSVRGTTVPYDGAPHGAVGECEGVNQEPLSATLNFGSSFTNVPGGTANWIFSNETTGNYADASGSVQIIINPIDQIITFDALFDKTYGDAPVSLSATSTSGLTVSFSSLSSSICTVSGTTATIVASGTCTLLASQSGNGNYNAAISIDNGFVVDPKTITVSLSAQNKTYDGDNSAGDGATCTPQGLLEGDTVTCSAVSYTFDTPNVGVNKVVTATGLTLGGADASKYRLSSTTATTTADIIAMEVVITPRADQFKTYGSSDPSFTFDKSVPVSVTGSLSRESGENAGSYAFTLGSLSAGSNYTLLLDPSSPIFTIYQASSTTTVSCPASVQYTGSPLTPCTAQVSGPNLSQSLAVNYSNNTEIGTATASATYPGDFNHLGSNNQKNFSITAASPTPVEVSLTNLSHVYDGTPKEAIALTNPESISYSITYNGSSTPPTDAGEYEVTATITQEGYEGSATDTLSIIKAATVTVVSCPASVEYTGDPLEPCTAQVTGAGGLEEPVAIDYTNNTEVGFATASAAYEESDNYFSSDDEKTFEITDVPGDGGDGDDNIPVEITLSNLSHIYNGTQKEATVTTDPEGLEVSVTYNGSSTPPTNAGEYEVTATITEDGYEGTATDTMVISKAETATTVSCPSSVEYTGDPLEPCTAHVTGAGGLAQELDVEYIDNTAVGTATASASYEESTNYFGSNGQKTFEITDVPVPPTPGCTDPEADNYDPDATVDDDSCTYPPDDGDDTDDTPPTLQTKITRTTGSYLCHPGDFFNAQTGLPCPQAVPDISFSGSTAGNISTGIIITQNYSLHSTSFDIKRLQEYLNTHGFVVAVAGAGSLGHETTFFGSLTYEALKRYQAAHNIPATGFLGPLTRAELAR